MLICLSDKHFSLFFILTKGDIYMFDIIEYLLLEFIDIIPILIALWLIFDFIGGLIFGKHY